MSDGTLAGVIDQAEAAIKDRPSMVSDGNVQEELALAFERHAERLKSAANSLRDVGTVNHLGPTSEGEAATYNIRLGVVDHEQSIYNTYLAQAEEAHSIADNLRRIGREILRTEGSNESDINRVIRP